MHGYVYVVHVASGGGGLQVARAAHVIVLTLAERKHQDLATSHITQTGSPSRPHADVISEKLTQCSRCLHTHFY